MRDDFLLPLMQTLAGKFVARLRQESGGLCLAPPSLPRGSAGLVWRNSLFQAAGFRRAHVELFEIPQHFAVVHVCILPHLWSAAPIFGFDMVAGHSQATGVFLDYSPVTASAPMPALADILGADLRARFKAPRTRPEWGRIFSDDFFAVRPVDLEEIETALALASRALDYFLCRLPAEDRRLPADATVLEGQSGYARAQRQNPHTLRMLARHVGPRAAQAFMDDVLFPLPN